MSHIATVNLDVLDLDALAQAAQRLGLELVRDQKTYRWYGVNLGGNTLPAGFSAEDLGRCDHALRLVGAEEMHPAPYEIGVSRRRDGQPGYLLFWDFWAGGFGLQARVGENCRRLRQEYACVQAMQTAMADQFAVETLRREDGSVRLQFTR
ncbi:hypothetical protein [Longimicrobium terrae]|uniref:DUF1257 domain-containing protein n=1 Tax=Longimicrobium terrae TaxID=1639882 RepID=A0A841GX64_9BACT|nr:hypothetical protein [Longimicrobium terrae]MBB4635929.1 hypothetical protein [Longimicrobium terrae]MBB6070325.1 hypothetical protein [Longimicrobium terrae]NNC30826.1 hypothetical protein [Longimicrobium terrae]